MLGAGLLALSLISLSRPNVVLILVDDLGWQDTSLSFGVSNRLVGSHFRTPNLRKLSARGIQVNQAYSSSTVCTPTRSALLTGIHPARSKITNWVRDGGDTDGGHPTLDSPKWNSNGLQPGDARTLADIFKASGYTTIQIGKAHFGAEKTLGADPTKLGFDLSIGGSSAGQPSSYYGLDNFAVKGTKPSEPGNFRDVPGLDQYHGKDIYLETALALEARKVIESNGKAAKPIFLWYSPFAVHTPIQANRALIKKYENLDPVEAAYATMVESVDNAIGTIETAFRKIGQWENTIVVFTSDNGGLTQVARGGYPNLNNMPLRSGKGSAYEGGIRVPFVIAGPGIVKGKVFKNLSLTSVDLFATLPALAGIPANKVDGVSVADSFRSGVDQERSEPLIWHYPHHRGFNGPGYEPHSSIRQGKFKAIYFYGTKSWELYNLEVDLGETRDIRLLQKPVLSELAQSMIKGLIEMKAQYPIDRASKLPVGLVLP